PGTMARSPVTISSRRDMRSASGAGILTDMEELRGGCRYNAKTPGATNFIAAGPVRPAPVSQAGCREPMILPPSTLRGRKHVFYAAAPAERAREPMIKDLVVNLSSGADSAFDAAGRY